MTKIAEVNPILFAATYGFKTEEETRPYLDGVFLQKHHKEGVIMVGTDGRALFVSYDKDGFVEEDIIVTVSDDVLKGCKKKSKIIGQSRSLIINANEEAIVYEGKIPLAISGECIIDLAFPNWRGVVPKTVGSFVGNSSFFNHAYIKQFSRAAKVLGTDVMTIAYGENAQSPMTIHFPKIPNVFGVLMPMRCDSFQGHENIKHMFDLDRVWEQSNA